MAVAAVVAVDGVVVAVAAVEYLAAVATYQDAGVTKVDVAAHQLDVAAVVVADDGVQVEGVVTEAVAAVAEPAIYEVAEAAQLLAVHDNMAGVVAEPFVEEVTSCVVVVEGLHDVVAAAVAAVVVVVDAENVAEPFAAEQEALVKGLAFGVEER